MVVVTVALMVTIASQCAASISTPIAATSVRGLLVSTSCWPFSLIDYGHAGLTDVTNFQSLGNARVRSILFRFCSDPIRYITSYRSIYAWSLLQGVDRTY